MQLSIDISGYKDEVVISCIPRDFLSKVVRHCYGKNNTPYFAHNCFKGVLYFDEELARKFASSVGYEWNGWWDEKKFHHNAAYVFESELGIMVTQGDNTPEEIFPSQVSVNTARVSQSALLSRVANNEALSLMGSIDKGVQTLTLDSFDGDFDPAKLTISVETFADFGLDDKLITSVSYDGQELTVGSDEHKGRRMIVPALFDNNGEELELDDFVQDDIL